LNTGVEQVSLPLIPEQCRSRHPWAPGLVTINWEPCDCPPALKARGGHIVVDDLLKSLDSGHLGHAYLDVFDTEPLPASSPLWRHPGVTITPHSAALTEPRTAIAKIVQNVERVRRGETPLHLVDFAAGY